MKNEIEKLIKEALKNLGITEDISFAVEHPDNLDNGDYSSNVAMVFSKKLQTNPRNFAEKIVIELNSLPKQGLGEIEKIEVAGPGFINFYLSKIFFKNKLDKILKSGNKWGSNDILKSKKIMVEYTDPNPFKPFHIGHLMANAIGESVSRLVEFSGAKVVRANYQGDVGPHVAKAIYAILNSREYKESGLSGVPGSFYEKANWIGVCYSTGSNLYDTDENIKKEIENINKKIYDKSDDVINKIYFWGREVTLLAFEEIYETLGTSFDKYYFESEVASLGVEIVEKNIGNVFEKSDNAIVFHAEKYDPKLHTRVFINSQGLPTYETKELGLIKTKFKNNIFSKKFDLSIVTTAVEQAEYMKVVNKAISVLYPELENKMKHITHGMMKLTTGKMSSRKGNVVTGVSLLEESISVIYEKMNNRDFSKEQKEKISKQIGVGALKYSILKSSIGSDIIYDFDKSISFDGDSGPYLQYTFVRANSILNKAKDFEYDKKQKDNLGEISDFEKLLYQFEEVVKRSCEDFSPHHIISYLTNLASAFNIFYGNTKILDKDNKNIYYQLKIIKAFSQTMENGLWLLGIETPERM